MRYTPHTIFILLAWLAISQLCVGCSSEDSQVEVPETKGTICLRMSSDEVYVQTSTRAIQTLTDFNGFTFTLNDKPIDFTNGQAMVEAGTYILSATNTNTVDNGYNGPLYYGETEEFTVSPGENKLITLNLGAPKNARLTVDVTEAFSTLYNWQSLALTDGNRTITLTPSNTEAFFPASNTTLTYTLVADAKEGSQVQDITSASGTVTIDAGKHTTLNLQINPIDPNLVVIGTGTDYNGEFQ
jgi:hypothetical protein